ncbi:serine hydrolase domain-containing protein [Streptomyces yaizuensis]|uniref:Serine hydrolase n=1 Tax=Streptomyces yaizuensis TaxID=2989713 RepID=A0ABQ5NUS4_9ACTN|nr:serine hydrolase domain-containing protein [Streptomyces sp. YSPA8]GLF94012.1 serine hydrolase [Streptomyces sp. YSPA8]
MTAGRRVRRTRRAGLVGVVAAAVAATVFTVPAQARDTGGTRGGGGGHEATQRAFDTLVAQGIPGVTGEARDSKGVWKGTSGVGDLVTGTPRGAHDKYRAGSITKTFVAVVLLQMEAEGRLDLDDSVEKHLPGLVRGNGNDGRKITVRQLLNHTSGLFNYTSDPDFRARSLLAPGFFHYRYHTYTPRDLVRTALAHRPDFAPGTHHSYSNTGYVLAGLIIEKAGGNSYEHEIRERIIEPLKLRGTSLPGRDPRIPAPSARNYATMSDDPAATRYHEVTENNMSWAWGVGDIISTTADLNRFLGTLLRGGLLPARQLAAMKTAVATPGDALYSSYGLGIYTVRNGCGATLWSHSGGVNGAVSEMVATPDGRHLFSYNLNGVRGMPTANPVDAEFCPPTGAPGGTAGTAATERAHRERDAAADRWAALSR